MENSCAGTPRIREPQHKSSSQKKKTCNGKSIGILHEGSSQKNRGEGSGIYQKKTKTTPNSSPSDLRRYCMNRASRWHLFILSFIERRIPHFFHTTCSRTKRIFKNSHGEAFRNRRYDSSCTKAKQNKEGKKLKHFRCKQDQIKIHFFLFISCFFRI